MPEFKIIVAKDGSVRIRGIKGKACKPFHESIARDLKAEMGLTEVSSEDTEEMRQQETVQQHTHLHQRS